MKTIPIFAVIFVGLLAGCASHKPAPAAKVKPPEASRKFEASDDFKIEAAVYGYLLEKHPWEGEYAAIFLQGSDDRVTALINKLPKHAPPLKPASRAVLRPNETPIDRATGKPALLLSAKAVGPTNGVSEAVGTWYGGVEASGLYAFVLVEIDGQWTIQSAK
ncbi:MAG: hypothetical protein ACLP7I_03245 [Limisphaerales bacterium]